MCMKHFMYLFIKKYFIDCFTHASVFFTDVVSSRFKEKYTSHQIDASAQNYLKSKIPRKKPNSSKGIKNKKNAAEST